MRLHHSISLLLLPFTLTPAAHIPPLTPAAILNFALTLEHLESSFYSTALATFPPPSYNSSTNSPFTPTLYTNLQLLAKQEASHVTFLTTALLSLGLQPVAKCQYTFPPATFTDPQAFLRLAATLEGVGVGAYLGAAGYINNTSLLTAAGSILSVEARHDAYLRAVQYLSPYAVDRDIPLPFLFAWTLASQFIVSCPETNPKLPFYAYPQLRVDTGNNQSVKKGDTVVLVTTESARDGEVLSAGWLTAGVGMVFGDLTEMRPMVKKGKRAHEKYYKAVVPEEVKGQVYVVIVCQRDAERVLGLFSDLVRAGPGVVEVEV